MNDVPPEWGHYLAGLIDGEGCFLICRKRPRPDMRPAMRIDLDAVDLAILMQLCEVTGLGTVKHRRSPSLVARGRRSVVWEVTSRSDCLTLVGLLDKYPLRAAKRLDYLVWRDFVAWWAARKAGDSWERGEELRELLMNQRSRP